VKSQCGDVDLLSVSKLAMESVIETMASKVAA
jgi:hypothetical protein